MALPTLRPQLAATTYISRRIETFVSPKEVNMKMMHIDEKPGWVRIACAGGCGRHAELRFKKVVPHDFYLCKSKVSGAQCETRLPPRLPGQIKVLELSAAASFMEISYRWPSPDEAAAAGRAQNNLASGLARMAIEKAMRS